MDLSQRLCPAAINPFALCKQQLFPTLDEAFAVVGDAAEQLQLNSQGLEALSCTFRVRDEDVNRLLAHEATRERQADAYWREAELRRSEGPAQHLSAPAADSHTGTCPHPPAGDVRETVRCSSGARRGVNRLLTFCLRLRLPCAGCCLHGVTPAPMLHYPIRSSTAHAAESPRQHESRV